MPTAQTPTQPRNFAPTTVIPGRPKAWLKDPTGISPVSCTNVVAQDSYYEPINGCDFLDTIAGTRVFVTKVLKGNAGVSVNLSNLRPKGTVGTQGLVASGVTNFLDVYSQINAEVRQGNGFKNGAVNVALNYSHPDWSDFINYPSSRIPWLKKVTIIDASFAPDSECHKFQLLLTAIAAGTTFVYKQQYSPSGDKLEINVCQAVEFANRSTCTLAHANLGMVRVPSDIPVIMLAAAEDLDWVWKQFAASQPDHFIPAVQDKQVGLGFVGLANMLAHFNVTYEEFTRSLEKLINKPALMTFALMSDRLAIQLQVGYRVVTEFARTEGYERFFAIEPTASCSYREVDLRGYTTAPEISPPTCHPTTRMTRRTSQEGFNDHQYPLDVEFAGSGEGGVNYDTYFRLCSALQILMNRTGLAHGISHNWWLEEEVTPESFGRWWRSPLKTIYYRWATSSSNQDKTSIGAEVSIEDEEFWGSGDEEEGSDPVVVCPIVTAQNDPNFCMACAG